MPNFSFLNRSVAYNSETTVFYITNGATGPLFNLNQLNVVSPSGCGYFLLRLYKNSCLLATLATPSVAQYTNFINQTINLILEPGSSMYGTVTNLDVSQATHTIEGTLE